jgi:hypothetical protein
MRLAVTKRRSSSAGTRSPRSHTGHNGSVMAIWGRFVHFLERRGTQEPEIRNHGTEGLSRDPGGASARRSLVRRALLCQSREDAALPGGSIVTPTLQWALFAGRSNVRCPDIIYGPGVQGPVAPGLPTVKMQKWGQVLNRESLTWSNNPVGADGPQRGFLIVPGPLVGRRSPGAFDSRTPLRRKGSVPLMFQHGLAEEGQPCKSALLAEWHRELWGTEPAREARYGKSLIWQAMITHWRAEPWKDAGS